MARFFVALLLALDLFYADAAWMVGTEDAAASEWLITSNYESATCSSPPAHVVVSPDCTASGSANAECLDFETSSSSSVAGEATIKWQASECSTNLTTSLDELFGENTYLRYDYFNDTDCTSSGYVLTHVFLVDGKCHSAIDDSPYSIQGTVNTLQQNGSITRTIYNNGDCTGEVYMSWEFNKTLLESAACIMPNIMSTNADLSGIASESSASDGNSAAGGSASDSAGATGRLSDIVTGLLGLIVALVV